MKREKNQKLYTRQEIMNDTVVLNHSFYDSGLSDKDSSKISGCTYNFISLNKLSKQRLSSIKCVYKPFYINASKGEEISKYSRELYFLCHLKYMHPCIVEIYGWNDDHIVLQYVEQSSLTMILEKPTPQKFTGTEKTKIILGIAHTLNYLNKIGIIHGDLSTNNILIDKNNEPVICDFGNSRYISEPPNQVGTPGYAPPEIIQSYVYNISNFKLDVFGFGRIVYELLEFPADQKSKNSNIFFDKIENKYMKFLIKICRATHPDQRLSFGDILKLIYSGKCVYPDTNIDEVRDYYRKLENECLNPDDYDP